MTPEHLIAVNATADPEEERRQLATVLIGRAQVIIRNLMHMERKTGRPYALRNLLERGNRLEYFGHGITKNRITFDVDTLDGSIIARGRNPGHTLRITHASAMRKLFNDESDYRQNLELWSTLDENSSPHIAGIQAVSNKQINTPYYNKMTPPKKYPKPENPQIGTYVVPWVRSIHRIRTQQLDIEKERAVTLHMYEWADTMERKKEETQDLKLDPEMEIEIDMNGTISVGNVSILNPEFKAWLDYVDSLGIEQQLFNRLSEFADEGNTYARKLRKESLEIVNKHPILQDVLY